LRNVFRARLRSALTILGLVIAILAFGLLQTVVPGLVCGFGCRIVDAPDRAQRRSR